MDELLSSSSSFFSAFWVVLCCQGSFTKKKLELQE
jgi:hypothetical protein